MKPQKRKALLGQLFRKLIQLLVATVIVWTAFGTHWRNFKVAHNSQRIVGLLRGDVAAWMYARNEDLLGFMGDPMATSEGFLGAPWGMTFFGWSFTDPWSLAAVAAGGHLPPTSMWLGAMVPLLIALVAGRLFCSYLCPARLVFEVAGLVRQGLLRLGIPLFELSIPPIGLWVGLGSVGFAAFSGGAVFHFVLPYLGFGTAVFSGVLTGSLGAAGLVFLTMVGVDALLAPGQICRSLCPTGALLTKVGHWAPWRLRKQPSQPDGPRPCPTTCDLCRRACPYGLFPGRETHFPGCDGCARCTVVCPETKLARSLSLSRGV